MENLLQNSLALLAHVVPYDLACIWQLGDGELKVLSARGRLVGDRILGYCVPVEESPGLARVLESERGNVLAPDECRFGGGDPMESVLVSEPEPSCLMAPIIVFREKWGVLSVKRERSGPYSEESLHLAELCCTFISLALEQREVGKSLIDEGCACVEVEADNRESAASVADSDLAQREPLDAVKTLDETIRAAIERCLALTKGRIYGEGGAAERLGLKPSTLQAKMKKLGIERSHFR